MNDVAHTTSDLPAPESRRMSVRNGAIAFFDESGEKRTREPSVTFETKCWENDWKFLLRTGRLRRMISRNQFAFARRTLMINNVRNVTEVCRHAQALVDEGVLTGYSVVEDYAGEALNFFELSGESLGRGYPYSIAELVSIYRCETEFLLHFSGDSIPAKNVDWIPTALDAFGANRRVRVANLTWDHRYRDAAKESFASSKDFFIGYGFSDQCYLIRTQDFRAPIYNEGHPASERYPQYGGELFEKRVDSWMRNHNLHRITYRHGSYVHRNFPKGPLRRGFRFALERAGR